MEKEFEPPAIEWQTETTKLGNYVAGIVYLEIRIDKEMDEHAKRLEFLKLQYESEEIDLDHYLRMVEESEAKLNRLRGLHTEDRDEINSLL